MEEYENFINKTRTEQNRTGQDMNMESESESEREKEFRFIMNLKYQKLNQFNGK